MPQKLFSCLLVALLTITLCSSAFAATLKDESSTDSSFIAANFSDDQVIRYSEILEAAQKTVTKRWVGYWRTIEEIADDPDSVGWYMELNGLVFTFGLPHDNDISDLDALFSAYSCLEQEFNETKERLSQFYPIFNFFVSNCGFSVWQVGFITPFAEYSGFYSVYVDSHTGDVFTVQTEADALGQYESVLTP